MMNSFHMPLLGLDMTSSKTSKRAINILVIKVVKGLVLEIGRNGKENRIGFDRKFVRTPRGQEWFYGGLEREWERTPIGQDRYKRELERNDVGYYEENEFVKIKKKIPSFQGEGDPKAYLEWEKKVELVFDYHHYSKHTKLRFAVVEFTNYSVISWDRLVSNQRRNKESSVETWEELKSLMQKRFISPHYCRDLYNKLKNLK